MSNAHEGEWVQTVAIGIFCKTPMPGQSKTRLSAPLSREDCAAISACFIRDLSATIDHVSRECGAIGYAILAQVGHWRQCGSQDPGNHNLATIVPARLSSR